MDIHIDIYFRTRSSTNVSHISLSPAEYFDPLESGETYSQNGVPKFNFTHQYLREPRENLLWSVERRHGTKPELTLSTQYWNEGKSFLIHLSDSDNFEEVIHAFDLGERGYMTVRTLKRNGGRWTTHLATGADNDDNEFYSLPEGAYDTAWQISADMAPFANSRPSEGSSSVGK